LTSVALQFAKIDILPCLFTVLDILSVYTNANLRAK